MTPINIWLHSRVEAISFVDDADAPLVQQWKWFLSPRGYAQASKGQLMHRVILGAQKGQVIDHIDQNPLNNVRSNIRIVSQSVNLHNQIRKTKSGVTGVKMRNGKWSAELTTEGVTKHLGTFPDKRTAIMARWTAVLTYWRNQELPVPQVLTDHYASALLATA